MDRSARRKAFKQTRRLPGVYGIRNTGDSRLYVGFGSDVQARLNRHKAELKFGNHRNKALQEAWNRLGETAFQFYVLDVLDPVENPRGNTAEELRTLAEIWTQKLRNAGDQIEMI